MSRIPQEEIERLKREIPVQRLAEERGIKLKPHGKDLIGLCKFHDDRSPSLVINSEKNIWNCLGACGTGGTVIDWVMKAEGVNFRQAVEILRGGAPSGNTPTTSPTPRPVSLDAKDREPLNQVVFHYHETLKQSQEALSYLEKRGLNNSEMIDRFKIGYSNRTLGNQLPDKARQEGAAIRERLAKTGIIRESGHEHFNGSIVIPVFDDQGQVSGMYGRKILDYLREGTAYHLYLPGPHKGVFNLEGLKISKAVILCEALIDALTFWCAGFHNVTASYGVNGFTPDYLEAFQKNGIETVYVAYDRDDAGDNAAEKLSRELIAEGFECLRVLFPRGMDANEYGQKVKPASKAFGLLIKNAVWIGGPASKAESLRGAPITTTKEENFSEVLKGQEALSPPCSETIDIFPLDAKKTIAEPQKPEPARNAPTQPEPTIEIGEEEIVIRHDDRRWRIRGLAKNTNAEQIKVNVLVSQGEMFFVDTFDLCSSRGRLQFQKQAAEELKIKEDIIKSDLGKIFRTLEDLQSKRVKKGEEPTEKGIEISDEDRKEALNLLQTPNIMGRVLSDFEKCGIVGEEINKLVGYLAAVSRKMENPLAVIIQSSSAAGKTSLMEAILAFMPEEERVKYSAMTGQSLFYMGETSLKHKILAIVEEEGAERASYALKLLQSEGELTIASTGKDPSTGKHITHEYRVEGPVMIFVTTTNVDIDEELQNRCIMLSVNESREQTRAIHKLQREKRTLEGLIVKKEKAKILQIHRNAQRLLKSIPIMNPYAPKLTFLDDRTRTRRDHEKYLNLIDTIALLHQFQRPLKTGNEGGKPFQYIEVTLDDIETANRLANDILGRSLDEMSPQTRGLLHLIEKMVMEAAQRLNVEKTDYQFSQREVREYTGFGNTQVKTHLHRLEELEYLIAYRGGKGQTFVYELIYDGRGKDGKPFLHGLIDVSQLREKCMYDGSRSGKNDDRSAPGRGEVMHLSGGGRGEKDMGNEELESVSEENEEKTLKNTSPVEGGNDPSYPNFHHTLLFPSGSLRKVM